MGDKTDDIERDLPENDGLRPDEDEGPGESDASPRRCEFRQGERMGGPEDAQFEVMDQIHDGFPIEPIPVVMAEDGLPDVITPDPAAAEAVPFTFDTQLCIADDRRFVEVFYGELPVRPSGTVSAHLRDRARFNPDGTERPRREFDPDDVVVRWGVEVVELGDGFLPVRPRRRKCRHYKRQVFSNDSQPDPEQPGHQIVFRVCAARRSNGGAFMSVSNEGIYACDFRDPPDPSSTQKQDEKDRRKLVDRPDRTRLPLFGGSGDAIVQDDQVENNT